MGFFYAHLYSKGGCLSQQFFHLRVMMLYSLAA
nr:MAG TPA: hypothetical protein [Caudoviricetes sp.]